MISIALYDDGTEVISRIENIILDFFKNDSLKINIMRYENANNLLYDIMDGYRYDLFLLEVMLPDMSGEELIKKIRKVIPSAYFVYITSQLKYAIEGYKLNLFRFIPKENMCKSLVELLEDLKMEIEEKCKKNYIIATLTKFEKIPFDSIYYIYKEKKYTIFVTSFGKSRERKGINTVYDLLDKNEFFWINRGYIINASCVTKLVSNSIYLEDGSILTVSRGYSNKIREQLKKFWIKHEWREKSYAESF